MTRLVATIGLLVIEAGAHAFCAGTFSTGNLSEPSLWSVVVPTLLGAGPSICRTADEWFRALTECG
jgi:hypothetical protein